MNWCKDCNRQIMSIADYLNTFEHMDNPIFCICEETKEVQGE